MQPFRSTRGGGVRAWLAASEASLLRNLVDQVVALITPDGPPHPASQDPKAKADDEIPALEALLPEPPPAPAQGIPQDPGLARLLPDGYRDDPEAAGEFRRYTEPALRSAKHQAAREIDRKSVV